MKRLKRLKGLKERGTGESLAKNGAGEKTKIHAPARAG